MSAFSTALLIDLSDIIDGEFPKTKEAVTQDYINSLYGANLATEFSFSNCFSGDLDDCSFDEERPPRYDDEGIIFGSVEPDKLIAFAKGMPDKVRATAEALMKQTAFFGAPFDAEMLAKIQRGGDDSLDNYRLRAALDMLCDKPTFESHILVYHDGLFNSLPNADDIESIEANPENWAVLPICIRY